MKNLKLKKAKDIQEFASNFDQATAGSQHIPADYFADVWEKGGVVRIGKFTYDIEIEAPKKPKAKKVKS